MAYRNDCHFDNGPDIVEPGNEMQGLEGSSSTGGFNSQSWLSAEQSMSGMTPSSGSMNGPAGNGAPGLSSGHGGNGHNTSGSGDDATDLTPASNTAGNDGATSSTNGGGTGTGPDGSRPSHLVAGQLGDSGQGSYQASPVSPHQNMMGQGEQSQFFGDPGSFGMTPQTSGFGMGSSGWGDMSGQGDMQPVGDGVLRALINMGPMSAMDLSTWNPTNENMRR